MSTNQRSHSQRAFARNDRTIARSGTDLFPSSLIASTSVASTSAVQSVAVEADRNRPIPDKEVLDDYGVSCEEFSARHRVVMCSLCQSAQSRNSFLMLQYTKRTPGEKAVSIGCRPQVKGTKKDGTPRIIWCVAPGLTCRCDEGHVTRMDSVTGELSCTDSFNERSELSRHG